MGGSSLLRVIFVFLLIVLPRAACAAESPLESATEQTLAAAVELLSDPSPEKRHEAEGKLWAAGTSAESILRTYIARAEAEGNTDGARRGELVLKYLPYGLTDATADTLIPLIDQFQAATELSAKQVPLRALCRAGSSAAMALLVTAEEDSDQREELFRYSRRYSDGRTTQHLIGEGRLDLAERWLALASTVPDQGGGNNYRVSAETLQQDYAVFLQLTGKLAAKIAEAEESLKKPIDESHEQIKHRLLADLHRLNGDLPAAITHARAAGLQGQHLLFELLWHAADWKASVELQAELHSNPAQAHDLGPMLAFLHLAGDEEKFTAVAAQHQMLAEQNPCGLTGGIPYVICARTDLALSTFQRMNDTFDAFDALCIQYRYGEALKLLEDATAAAMTVGKPVMDFHRFAGHAYRRMGLLARSDESFGQCAGAAQKHSEEKNDNIGEARCALALLAAEELEWGLKEQAFKHVAQGLDMPGTQDQCELFLLQKSFGFDAEVISAWKLVRKKYADEPLSTSFGRLRAIREKTMSAADLRELVHLSEDRNWGYDVQQSHLPELLHIQIVKELNGAAPTDEQRAEMEALLKMLPPTRGGSDAAKRAEFLVDSHDNDSAIAEYGRQWELDKSQPLPLYLKGLSLRRAGREDEAKKAIDLAHLIPLGQVFERQQLWKDLSDRGFADEAQRQRDVLMQVDRGSSPADDALRPAGIAAWKRGESKLAASLFDQSLPGLSQCDFFLNKLMYYFNVADDHHRMMADAFIADGNADEAVRALRICQTVLPVSSVPIDFAAKLEALDHRADADALVASASAVHEANLLLYPDAPLFHSELAWLLAKTHRRLDDALIHAQKAVTLLPKHYQYKDTLAEVYFHQGDREKAVATMQAAKSLAAEAHSDEQVAEAEKRIGHFEKDPIPTGADKRE